MKIRTELYLRACTLSLAIAALSAGTAVRAQAEAAPDATSADAAKDNGADIVVVGSFARGLQSSISLKRESDTIVDAIVAADIGELPAVNVAEALQRVPGVSIVREAGEGEFVSVRGLGPSFQSVTLNGVPIAFNENVRNSDQSGRQFRFRVLPADLIGGLVVAKSSSADLLDGGIGSNIDVRTISGLDRSPFLTVRAFANYDDRARGFTPNGSISGSWRNADETFGVIAGVSYQARKAQFERLQTFSYGQRTINGTAGVFVPEGWNATLELEDRRRYSAVVGVQWRPSEKFETRLEGLYTRFDNEIDQLRLSVATTAALTTAVPGSLVVRNNTLVAATFQGGIIGNSAEFSKQLHKNTALSWISKFKSNGWQIDTRLSYSKATSGLPIPLQRVDVEEAANPARRYTYDFGRDPLGDRRIAVFNGTEDLTDGSTNRLLAYRIRPIDSKDDDLTGFLDVSRELVSEPEGFAFTSIKVGGQFSDRSRDYQRRDRTLGLRPGLSVNGSFFTRAIPSNSFKDTIGDVFTWVAPTYAPFRDSFVLLNNEFDGVTPSAYDLAPQPGDLRTSYRIDETVTALYGRLNFGGNFHEIPFSGNIGLRWVHTDATTYGTIVQAVSNGRGGVTTQTTPRATDSKYGEFLPSFSVNFDLSERVKLRLAASRTIARPSLSDLRDATSPNSTASNRIFTEGQAALTGPNPLTAGELVAVGGNPLLKPYRSTNFDGALEWYFGGFGAVSLAAFYKDITNFVSSDGVFEALPFQTQSGQTIVANLLVNRPRNVGDASISGLEFSYSDRLENGLGLSSSVTFISTSLKLTKADGTSTSATIQGVPKLTYTISPFFESGPFEAHLAWTYRSSIAVNGNLTVASDPRTDPNTLITQKGFGTLDFGISYKLNDRFEFYADGANLLNAREAAYIGSENRPYQINSYGRNFNFGVRATF